MPASKRPSIKEQARIRKAAAEAKKATKTTGNKTTATKSKTTAKKTTSTKATKPTATTPVNTNSNGNGARLTTNTAQVLVPGLTSIDPNDISGMLPQFDSSNYNITDPLKPPANLPQVSEADFDAGMNTYQGSIRALRLTGTAFDVTRERFTTEGKKAKAFGAGVKTATEFEKVKADFIDYQTQLQTNTQKSSGLSLAQKRTQFVQDMAIESETEMTEKLESAKVGAEMARLQRTDKQSKLDEFRKQLTGGN